MRSHEALSLRGLNFGAVNITVPQSKLWGEQSLPVPPDLRHCLQVLHHFLQTGWLPYP